MVLTICRHQRDNPRRTPKSYPSHPLGIPSIPSSSRARGRGHPHPAPPPHLLKGVEVAGARDALGRARGSTLFSVQPEKCVTHSAQKPTEHHLLNSREGGGRAHGYDAFICSTLSICATREMCHPFCTKTDGASSSEWQGRWRPRARVRRFHLTLSSVQPEKCVTHSAQKTAASIAQGIIIF